MLHVPLDSIIESVIAASGVLLWVSSVCWDAPTVNTREITTPVEEQILTMKNTGNRMSPQ